MKANYTHIAIVLDRSGSMTRVRQDTIGGFNTFLTEQKKAPGKATLTLAQFDTAYELIHDFSDIQSVPDLNIDTFVPRGMTALYDGIGRTVTAVGKQLYALADEERPSKVLVVIMTDGGENSSQEFNALTIKSLIERQQTKYQWEFVFIGANQDAVLTANGLGIGADKSMTYAANTVGTQAAFASMSYQTSMLRSGAKASYSFDAGDYAAQASAGVQ